MNTIRVAMPTLADVKNQFDHFASALPQDTARKAAKSFVYSFSLSMLFSGGNVGLGLACGTVALTASLVHALTKPLFEKIAEGNDDKEKLSFPQYMARVFLSVSAGELVANAMGYTIPIGPYLAITTIVLMALNGVDERPVDQSQGYYVF
jgi:hypothetical protein